MIFIFYCNSCSKQKTFWNQINGYKQLPFRKSSVYYHLHSSFLWNLSSFTRVIFDFSVFCDWLRVCVYNARILTTCWNFIRRSKGTKSNFCDLWFLASTWKIPSGVDVTHAKGDGVFLMFTDIFAPGLNLGFNTSELHPLTVLGNRLTENRLSGWLLSF